VAFGADSEHDSQVRAARWHLTSALIERGASVGFLEWPLEEGKGIDDRLARVAPGRVLADIAAVEFGDWGTRLLRSEEGRVIACYENVAMYLENSTDWSGVLGYNEFTAGYFVLKPPPVPVTAEVGSEIEDHFETELVRWLERRKLMVKPDLVRRVVDRTSQFLPPRPGLFGISPCMGRGAPDWHMAYRLLRRGVERCEPEQLRDGGGREVPDIGCKAHHGPRRQV
jgi:hypothetical protein